MGNKQTRHGTQRAEKSSKSTTTAGVSAAVERGAQEQREGQSYKQARAAAAKAAVVVEAAALRPTTFAKNNSNKSKSKSGKRAADDDDNDNIDVSAKTLTRLRSSSNSSSSSSSNNTSTNTLTTISASKTNTSTAVRRSAGVAAANAAATAAKEKQSPTYEPAASLVRVSSQKSASLPAPPAAITERRSRQLSTWSTTSSSNVGVQRLNLSFSSIYCSFRNRNKLARKSLRGSLRGSKRTRTIWHKPLTNAIFATHFPESSRNEQLKIELIVNKGAFGVVFKVVDATSTAASTTPSQVQCYALKVLKKSKIIEENSVQQLKDEADIQKICGHNPFIVQQFERWQNRYNLHILSEYVPNGELFSKISRFTADLVRIYAAEIALAIDFLHNAGIIYRDAKPENILLTESYHIKLTDFGLSKWLKLGATTGTMCGTLKYIAPEVLRGERYGHAVDWWALGIIVCQMFTQKCPNIKRYLAATSSNANGTSNQGDIDDGEGNMTKSASVANINGHLIERYDYLPRELSQLSDEAQDIIRRLLEVDPRQRLRSILSMQRIAFYKSFKIETKQVLKLRPLDIIERDNIRIYEHNQYEETCSALATETFRDF